MADDVQIKFTADAGSAIGTIGALKEALAALAPAMAEFNAGACGCFATRCRCWST